MYFHDNYLCAKPAVSENACIPCHIDTMAPAGSDNISNCTKICQDGEFLANSGSCELCPENTMSVGGPMDKACVDCEWNESSSEGSINCQLLNCATGEVPFNHTCIANNCPIRTYLNMTGLENNEIECITCPEGFITEGTGKTSSSDCVPLNCQPNESIIHNHCVS